MEARDLVAEFWRRIQARDWDGLSLLLSEDFSVDWPDARLRIRGREHFVEFNRTYPDGWTIDVLSITADEDTVVSEVRVPHTKLGIFYVVSVMHVDGDHLSGGREYWLQEHEEDVPDERARLLERI